MYSRFKSRNAEILPIRTCPWDCLLSALAGFDAAWLDSTGEKVSDSLDVKTSWLEL